ncbi:hypothetical protein [Actinomycetospora sp. NBRC 106375]|uniref:hypothetical protein n=1 Tax=Actinomycetospora sp. NBRC 106375 TaxID=3032207 RepID=UPI00255640F6|nr:hypothetical protein [Actinomycetospora sp. NBRC 106375]
MVTTAPAPSAPWGPPPAGLGGPGTGGMLMYPGIAPPARRPRWPWVLGAVAAVVVVLGLFGTVLAPATTVSGTVTFYASNYLTLGTPCTGLGLYSDLEPGRSVLVYDDKGAQVGQGTLGSGIVTSSGSSSYGYGNACQFSYSVSAEASDSYRVVVGQRAGVVFTAEQADGHADIAIGS